MQEKYIRIVLDSKDAEKGAGAFNSSMIGAGFTADKLTTKVKALALAISGVVAAQKITAFFASAIAKTKEFDKSISDLSAITGAVGDDLIFLSDAAKEFGATTTLSATQAATAIKLIASAKPDLLENRDALKAVTREAIFLAEAAGIELPEAANALGTSLNQFNESAEESGRYINVLAAGAKYGSSEISETAQALKNAGVSAAGANVSFEQTNAAIQVLAKAGLKGAEAGTNLRNVLTILETQADDKLRPSLVGLGGAIDELSKRQLNATDLTKLFGRENQSAARILTTNSKLLDQLEKKLTGTSTAYEQAATRTDNLASDTEKLSSAYESLQLAVGEVFTPAARSSVKAMTVATNSLANSVDIAVGIFQAFSVVIGAKLAVAIGTYAAATITAATANTAVIPVVTGVNAALGIQAARAATVTTSMRAMTVAARGAGAALAFVGGPVGLAIIAASALVYFATTAREAEDDTKRLAEEVKTLTESYAGLEAEASKARAVAELANIESELEIITVNLAAAQEKLAIQTEKADAALKRGTMSGYASSNMMGAMAAPIITATTYTEKWGDKVDALSKNIDVLTAKKEALQGIINAVNVAPVDPASSTPEEAESTVDKTPFLNRVQSETALMAVEFDLRRQLNADYASQLYSEDLTNAEREIALTNYRIEQQKNAKVVEFEREMAQLTQRREAIISDEDLTLSQRQQLTRFYDEQEIMLRLEKDETLSQIELDGAKTRQEIAENEANARKAIAQDLGRSLLSNASVFGKKAFEIGKKISIAMAIKDGIGSAVAAWNAGMSTGGPYAPAVAAAYTGASLLKTGGLIKQIQSTTPSGGSAGSIGGGASMPSIGGGASIASNQSQIPETASNTVAKKTIIDLRGREDGMVRVDDLPEIFANTDTAIILNDSISEATRIGAIS